MRNFLYVSDTTDGHANLAFDEWLLDNVGDDDLILYLYVNAPSVIIGKNQNPWKECDLARMRADGVRLVRRISGGGAVYHDEENLNFSFIAGKNRYDRERQFRLIQNAVRNVGIECEFSGRNDLLADGKKFSGNAFCARGDKRQHHGTLLINTKLDRLQNYLTPDPRKIRSKGIDSVRARVCNLAELAQGLDVDKMKTAVCTAFREDVGEYELLTPNGQNRAEIAMYYEKHSSWEWCLGSTPKFDIEFDTRFAWGGVQLQLSLEKSVIKKAVLYTDAINEGLSQKTAELLVGERFDRNTVCAKLSASNVPELCDMALYLIEQDF